MKKKHLDPSRVRTINDVDLADPFHLRKIIEQWDTLEYLSQQHIKVKDLFIELEERWIRSPLSPLHRAAIRLYLIEGYTQKEAGDKLEVGTRAIANAVTDGLLIMAAYGGTHDRRAS